MAPPSTDQNNLYPSQYHHTKHARLNKNALKYIGILHVLVGLLTLTLGVSLTVVVGIKYWLFSTGIGIWVGLLIIVTGCINIKTATTATNRCTVIICAFINIITLFLSLLSAFRFVTALSFVNNCSYNKFDKENVILCNNKNVDLKDGIYSGGIILMGTEVMFTVLTIIYCCVSKCGGHTRGIIIQQSSHYDIVATDISNTDQYYSFNVDHERQVRRNIADLARIQSYDHAIGTDDMTSLIASPPDYSEKPPPYSRY